MRIAVVIAGPYPALRGSQVLVAQTVAALSQCDHDVRVVSYGRRLADRPGFHPVRLPLNALLLARLARVVWRERIDIIHAHNYEALLVGLLVGRVMDRPVVYHGHSAMEDELPTYTRGPRRRVLLRRLGGWMDRAMPRCADASIAVTDQLADRLRTHGARHVRCLEPVLAPGSLVGADPAPTVISPNVVAYAGNLDAYQDLTFLLDAFSRVRDASRRGAGRGPARWCGRRGRRGLVVGDGVGGRERRGRRRLAARGGLGISDEAAQLHGGWQGDRGARGRGERPSGR